MSSVGTEQTEHPCQIPGCNGFIAVDHGWRYPKNPRCGGGPQGHAIVLARYCSWPDALDSEASPFMVTIEWAKKRREHYTIVEVP